LKKHSFKKYIHNDHNKYKIKIPIPSILPFNGPNNLCRMDVVGLTASNYYCVGPLGYTRLLLDETDDDDTDADADADADAKADAVTDVDKDAPD
jgi:hypothetical protein